MCILVLIGPEVSEEMSFEKVDDADTVDGSLYIL